MEINTILANLLATLVIALATYIINYVKVKTDILKQKNESKELNKYIDMFNSLIENSVVSVTQTYVDALKKDNAFTLDAQEKALSKAREQVFQLANTQMLDAVQSVYGDLNAYLNAQIEKQVYQLKLGE